MTKDIAVIKGDGIGPEIVGAALEVLDAAAEKFNRSFRYNFVLLGGEAIDKTGEPMPEETLAVCKNSDAVLMGSVGGPKWDGLPPDVRPEKGLLALRKGLGLFANIRPAVLYPELIDSSPLKAENIKNGIDIVVVRELTGGIYFGPRGVKTVNGEKTAFDTEIYSGFEIERIAHAAFKYALSRSKKVTSVDKANVLDSSKLWRETVIKVSKEYPSVALEHILVDNCAMQLIKNPNQFDVLLTPNMFGDILSDEAAMITGSIGLLPSSSLGDNSFGLYEPIHGSAPDIAGQNKANPIATILSAAMMLKTSFGMDTEAESIHTAVKTVLAKGYRTADIAYGDTKKLSCSDMGKAIAQELY
jgi:3-isopropylmalate dehydrogenase